MTGTNPKTSQSYDEESLEQLHAIYPSMMSVHDVHRMFHPQNTSSVDVEEGSTYSSTYAKSQAHQRISNMHPRRAQRIQNAYRMFGFLQEDDEEKWWIRRKCASFVEWRPVELTMAILLVIDIAIIITDLVLFSVICDIESSGHHPSHGLETAEVVLRYISVGILSIFCLDLILTFIGFGFRMFKHLGYVLDAIVIPTALVLELLVADVAGLLILGRLWRVIRVVHGAGEVMHDIERDLAKSKVAKKVDELETTYKKQLMTRDKEIERLNAKLGEGGGLDSVTDSTGDPDAKEKEV